MKIYTLILILFISFIGLSCADFSNNDPSIHIPAINMNELFTIRSDSTKIIVYSMSATKMCYGYNDIGFRVYFNDKPQEGGFLKFKPMMYHSLGGPGHSSPISDIFNHDLESNTFRGYACFTMISDSGSYWYANINYNNEILIDSVLFDVGVVSGRQLFYWDDVIGGHTYCLTLVEPFYPVMDKQDFSVLLHRTNDDKNFIEIDSAQMSIKAYYQLTGETTTFTNPLRVNNGKYKGSINLTKSGTWLVQDTIRINGNKITKNPPPDFLFNVR